MSENRKVFAKAAAKAKVALQKNDLTSTIAWAKIAAHFAFIRHPGFYMSLELENTLIEVAQKIKQQPPEVSGEFYLQNKPKNIGKMRFLHVVTENYETGGHSLFLDRWVQNTIDTHVHSLISTAQNSEISNMLKETLDVSGGWNVCLPELSPDLAEQALLLRLLAHNWADVVVLFTHPFDPVPVVAFGVSGGPPVVLVNHADHAFWLGASVADLIVDYHSSAAELSTKRRGTKKSKILPMPLIQNEPFPQREAAREELGFEDGEIVLFTVGREEKYYPYNGVDFLNVMVEFLKKHPNTYLVAAGPVYTESWHRAHEATDGKVVAMGQIDRIQLEKCYSAADCYVASFPCGSGTALLEAAMHNLPIVGLHLADFPHLSLKDDVGFSKLDVHQSTVEGFKTALSSAISEIQVSRQRALEVKENVEREHCPPGWNSYLNLILQSLPSLHHLHRPKPRLEVSDLMDVYWESISAKMMGDESPWHSYNRLIRTYKKHLPKKAAINSQAQGLVSELVRLNNFNRSRQFIKGFGEFVDSAFERNLDV